MDNFLDAEIRALAAPGAKIQADIYASDAYAVLDGIDGDTGFLRELVTYVRNREK